MRAQDIEAKLGGKQGQQLRKVLKAVIAACDAAKTEKIGYAIRDTYSRAEKQSQTELIHKEFKAPEKIAKILTKLHADDIRKIDDICGVTVVVYYPDQIDSVLAAIEQLLAKRRIAIRKDESGERLVKKRRTGGYYATHAVFESDHAEHRGYRCELQLKTMLHDAWAAKTHDLTYKPHFSSRADKRLDRLMQVFGDALDAIEVQSELIRDLIEERWYAEREWREILRRTLVDAMPAWMDLDRRSEEFRALRVEIQGHAEHYRSANEDDAKLQEILEHIDKICERSIQDGYLLAVYFASVTNRPREKAKAEDRAREWLEKACTQRDVGVASDGEIFSIPLAFYVCENTEGAIAAARRLIEADLLTGRGQAALKFNLANFLIDLSYFDLPDSAEERSELRREIEELISSAHQLRAEDATPFLDAEGMLEITLSQDTSVLQNAIAKITLANADVPDDDAEAADKYYQLHIRLAWRRLLEIETSKARSNRQP